MTGSAPSMRTLSTTWSARPAILVNSSTEAFAVVPFICFISPYSYSLPSIARRIPAVAGGEPASSRTGVLHRIAGLSARPQLRLPALLRLVAYQRRGLDVELVVLLGDTLQVLGRRAHRA